ncbi:MAG: hypothetical protein RLZZ627_408 [Pseudomonadota bacterium]|jgi:uncharacterized protein (DUF934 family)
MKIIKSGHIVEDQWTHLDGESALPSGASVTLGLDRLEALTESERQIVSQLGVRIGPDEDVTRVKAHLHQLDLIVLVMNPFTDGRSFSQARILREQLGFRGEIRASGDFLRDQMYYLHRLGVDSFEFAEGTDLNDRLKAFSEFSVTYQAAQDEPQPLYRRRG